MAIRFVYGISLPVFSAFLFSLAPATAFSTACTEPSESPILHYSFNEGGLPGSTVKDLSGWGRTGTLVNDATGQVAGDPIEGEWGAAVSFDGTGDVITVDNGPMGDICFDEQLTIMAWVKIDGTPANNKFIVHKYVDNSGFEEDEGFRLLLATGRKIKARVKVDYFGSNVEVQSTTQLLPGQWYHVAYVFDSKLTDTAKLYINGVKEGEAPTGGHNILNRGKDLNLGSGGAWPGNIYAFEGDLDDFRIYDRALVESEIDDIISALNGEPDLLFYESFDQLVSAGDNAGDITFIGSPAEEEASDFGNAIKLGTGDGFSIPAADNINMDSGTISFWFKPEPGTELVPRRFVELFSSGSADGLYLRTLYNSYWKKTYFISELKSAADDKAANIPYTKNFRYELDESEWHYIELHWGSSSSFINTASRKSYGPYVAVVVNNQLSELEDVKEDDFDMSNLAEIINFGAIEGYASIDENPSTVQVDSYFLNGWIDELKIYSATTFDLLNAPEALVRKQRGNGIPEAHETIYNSPDALRLDASFEPAQDVLFFQTGQFEPVYEGTIPQTSPSNIVNASVPATYYAAQSERESLFFNVHSRLDLTNATVTVTNMTGPGADIVPESLRMVRNWWQASNGNELELFPAYRPELLLYSDDITLGSSTISLEELAADSSVNYQNLPSIAVAPALSSQTDFQAHTSKQFMITVDVPAGQDPGIYEATVILTSPEATQSLKVNLTVRDYALEAPRGSIMTFHRAKYDAAKRALVGDTASYDETGDEVSAARHTAQFDNLVANGFTGIKSYGNSTTYVGEPVSEGLVDKLIFDLKPRKVIQDIGFIANEVHAQGAEPYFFMTDEAREKGCDGNQVLPGNPGQKCELEELMSYVNDVHNPADITDPETGESLPVQPGFALATMFYKWVDCLRERDCEQYTIDDPNSSDPDDRVPVDVKYTASMKHPDIEAFVVNRASAETELYLRQLVERTGIRLSDTGLDPARPRDPDDTGSGGQELLQEQVFYWQSAEEDPRKHRLYSGMMLHMTGLDGVMPYAYMHYKENPYNDFIPYSKAYRQDMYAYPSANGPVETMQLAAFREGVDDYRQLQFWEDTYLCIKGSYTSGPKFDAADNSYTALYGPGGIVTSYRDDVLLNVTNGSGADTWRRLDDVYKNIAYSALASANKAVGDEIESMLSTLDEGECEAESCHP